MVALGFWFILLFVLAYAAVMKGTYWDNKALQKAALFTIPLPWIAISFGWSQLKSEDNHGQYLEYYQHLNL
jgi:cytochrome d ubiquinol oxidase subunit I